jgi:TonB family protein
MQETIEFKWATFLLINVCIKTHFVVKKQIIMRSRKNILPIIYLLILTAINLAAQSDAVPDNSEMTPSVFPDQMPYFKGCTHLPDGSVEKRTCSNQALVTYIAKNVVSPSKSDVVGVVYVSFYVEENGRIADATILRGLSTEHNEAALKVVRTLPTWEPALLAGKPIRVKMKLPIRFAQRDESEFSNGFQLTWGTLKSKKVSRSILQKMLIVPITIRDDSGNKLEINELLFERDRRGKVADAQSNGIVNDDMMKVVKKLKSGDVFTITATVQKKGQFFYVDRSFDIE